MAFFRRLFKSFGYAFRGWGAVLAQETNLKIHSVVAACVVVAGFAFSISAIEWLAVTLCIGVVFSAELFNTAIEKMADFVEPNINPKIGLIKDIAAAAVLVCAIMSVVIGMIIFIPKLIALFV